MRPEHILRAALVLLSLFAFGEAAGAQSGGIRGVVLDIDGEPIKGATIRAENPTSYPPQFTATSDDKGRFAILGMKSGVWTFVAQAPGYEAQKGSTTIRATLANNMPVKFTLSRAATPLPGALTEQIQEELAAADEHRAAGRFDQALAAYEQIAQRNQRLTLVTLAIAETYRQEAMNKAGAARQSLLDKALAASQRTVDAEPSNERARIELALILVHKGNPAAAEALLATSAESPGATRELFYTLGEIKFNKGDNAGAEAMFQRALALDPAWQRPGLKLGLIAVKKGDREAALKHFNQVIAADASSTEAAEAGAHLKKLALN